MIICVTHYVTLSLDPNLKDGEQKTPLHSACEGNDEKCEQLVQLLLSK